MIKIIIQSPKINGIQKKAKKMFNINRNSFSLGINNSPQMKIKVGSHKINTLVDYIQNKYHKQFKNII